jgi:shikimate dehydrogenase
MSAQPTDMPPAPHPGWISGKARLAGVIGHPVSHSRSPRLHGFWLARHGIDGAYLPLAVDPADLAAVLHALPRMGFRGVNLTLPHKQLAMAMVDRIDPATRAIGAVNTLVFDDAHGIAGYNTDGYGFGAALAAGAPGRDVVAPALVLGAGGAARAVVHALATAGCTEIRIANRSAARAAALVADLAPHLPGCRLLAVDWQQRGQALDGCGTLVNTTSLGLAGQPPLDMALDMAGAGLVVSDIVYDPLDTPLLAMARARGLVAVDGLGMLLHQAVPGFEHWFGLRPVVDDALRRHVAADLIGD